MSSINALVRKDLHSFANYTACEIKNARVFLHANESPWEYRQQPLDTPLNRYPEFQPGYLIKIMADFYGVSQDNLLLSCGSDQAIDLLIRLFCMPKEDAVLISPPTFSMYEFYSKLQSITVQKIPLAESFIYDVDKVTQDASANVKIVFVCTPNNPTGSSVTPDKIIQLCEFFSQRSLVVVDEAYIEFSAQKSMSVFLQKYPNLVVLRTLSKAHGLAGARSGVTLANPEVINWLKKIIAPYPIPSLTLDAVHRSMQLNRLIEVEKQVALLKDERERVATSMAKSKMIKQLWKSDANFIFFQAHNAKEFLTACAEKGIVIRHFEKLENLVDCFRVAIATKQENDLFLEIIE